MVSDVPAGTGISKSFFYGVGMSRFICLKSHLNIMQKLFIFLKIASTHTKVFFQLYIFSKPSREPAPLGSPNDEASFTSLTHSLPA